MRFVKNVLAAGVFAFAAAVFFPACSFFSSFTEEKEDNIRLSFDRNKMSILTGEMDVLSLSASEKQNSAKIRWEYDPELIYAVCDNYSAVITGLKAGTATLTARCGSNSASCVITVSAENYAVTVTNPYVYASQDYVSVSPNSTAKISASLFGGTAGDIDGFSWAIDKPSVASISCEGNYCWITGLNVGTAKITVKHNKAAYGYSVLVSCASDGTTVSYITTSSNIITMNLSENDTADFSVSLENPPVTDFTSGFTYTVVDELGNEMTSSPAVIESASGLNVTLRARSTGNCMVRVSHPNALYYLDVLVRVIENAETGYIEPSETILTVTGEAQKKLDLTLSGFSGTENASDYSWSFSDGWEEYIDCEILNGNGQNSGNCAYIKGKKTGSVRITINYPGLSSRSVVVLVRDIATISADSTTYITTSQNYLRMSREDGEVSLSVCLKNCAEGDISSLKWKIRNVSSDGSDRNVILWKGGNGTSSSSYGNGSARSASYLDYSESAYALFEPCNPGTAYIEVSHPKAVYKTLITVVVTDKSVSETPYLSLCSSPLFSVKNGETCSLNVLVGGNGDESSVAWNVTEGPVSINPNGKVCAVSAPSFGTGGTKSIVTASLGDSTVSFTVITYDFFQDAESIMPSFIYSTAPVKSLVTGENLTLTLLTEGNVGVKDIRWSVISGSDFISAESSGDGLSCNILALASGSAQVKASYPSCDDVVFTITVSDKDIVNPAFESYLSTDSNVVYFSTMNEAREISVLPQNIAESSWHEITWTCSSTLFEISANGAKATVTALSDDAEATLTVKHPLSENELVINLRSGSRYVYRNEDTPYITADKDVLELFEGQDESCIHVTLNHTEESEPSGEIKGFSFKSSDEKIATVSYVNYSNTCYIKPLKNGTCKVIVSHPDAGTFDKEIVIIVKHSAAAASVPYITTEQNVITVLKGDYATASVSLVNSTNLDSTAWEWSSDDGGRIASVIAKNGTSAMISANKPGTTQIIVTHRDAPNPLKIIVVVLDAGTATASPYISLSKNIINVSKGASSTVTADIIGGSSDADSNYFKFYSSDSSVALVTSASGSVSIHGVNAGLAYVTVSNARYPDSYSRNILVVVEDSNVDGVYITASSKILKMKPDDNSIPTITATLVNGEATDAQDFIWWADDYSLVSITTVADTCAVKPVGKSGTTKIHVKHAKAAKQCDILVLVSKYEAFAFSQSSATVSSDKLYFYPMQVPSLESGCTIQYSSSNPDVCLVEGSNTVAWVCGLTEGKASLTANLVTEDGTIAATAEMLVNVEVPVVPLPVISVGNSILTVQAGEGLTLAAVISGDGVEESEKFNLKWSVKGDGDGVEFLNEQAGKAAYGSDCYITFTKENSYVIQVEHERTGAVTDICIVVEDKKEIGITLNTNYETCFRDDGSFTLTATLTNATESDYKEIEWSAVKVGGVNVVSVSKTKGKNCTVTPKSVGQTTVIARFPNGKMAKCIVNVKANAEIHFDVGSVHVIPGYTQIVNYTTNPANATVNWVTQMANSTSDLNGVITNYFEIEDDPVKKQLHVRAIKDYNGGAAGTVTAILMGASASNLPKLTVYTEYEVELSVTDTNNNVRTAIQNKCPDTNKPVQFNVKYYPTDLDIDILLDDTRVACITDASADNKAAKNHTKTDWKNVCGGLVEIGEISKKNVTEEGIDKVLMTVSLIPHSEGECNVKVVATLPSDESGRYSVSKKFLYTAYYDKYDLAFEMEPIPTGAYTTVSVSGNKIFLSDGEEAYFSVRIINENAKGEITRAEWSCDPSAKAVGYERALPAPIKGDSRTELAKIIFGTDPRNVGDGNKISKLRDNQFFLSLAADTLEEGSGSSGRKKKFRLRHNWDFYNEIVDENGMDLTVEKNWIDWYGSRCDKVTNPAEKKGKQFEKDLWKLLANNKVDSFVMLYEPCLGDCSFIPHDGRHLSASGLSPEDLRITWKTDWNNEDYRGSRRKWRHRSCYWLTGTVGKNEVFHYLMPTDGTDEKPDRYWSTEYKYPVIYKKCVPYVISRAVLEKNCFFNPDIPAANNENKSHTIERDFYDGDNYMYLSYAAFLSPYGKPCVLPVVSVDSTPVGSRSGGKNVTGNIKVFYRKAGANADEEFKTNIPVEVQKRMCRAYTKGDYTDDAQYSGIKYSKTMGDSVFPDKNTVASEFYLKRNYVATDTLRKDWDVAYRISPAGTPIHVKVPSGLSVLNGRDIGNDEYVVDGVQDGTIRFDSESRVDGDAEIWCYLGSEDEANKVSYKVHFDVKISPNWTLSLSGISGNVEYDESSRMLVIEDGSYAYIDAVKRNNKAKNAYAIRLDFVSLVADSDDNKKYIEYEDINGNVKQYKNPSYISPSAGELCRDLEGNPVWMCELMTSSHPSHDYDRLYIGHNLDFGYFGYKSGLADKTQDRFFKKDFPAKEDVEDREALHKEKLSYAESSSGSMGKMYTLPYKYINDNLVEGNVSYNGLIPVGKIVLTYCLSSSTKWTGNSYSSYPEDSYDEEFLVMVRVSDRPCKETAYYGYEPVKAYWR